MKQSYPQSYPQSAYIVLSISHVLLITNQSKENLELRYSIATLNDVTHTLFSLPGDTQCLLRQRNVY